MWFVFVLAQGHRCFVPFFYGFSGGRTKNRGGFQPERATFWGGGAGGPEGETRASVFYPEGPGGGGGGGVGLVVGGLRGGQFSRAGKPLWLGGGGGPPGLFFFFFPVRGGGGVLVPPDRTPEWGGGGRKGFRPV